MGAHHEDPPSLDRWADAWTTSQDDVVTIRSNGGAPPLFNRLLAADQDVERIFANLERHLVEMVEQSLDCGRSCGKPVLRSLSAGPRRPLCAWWLYGSGALAVRGIDVSPGTSTSPLTIHP